MRVKASDLPRSMQTQINDAMLNWRTPATPGGHKYRARETWVDNIRFPSKLQAECYKELKLRWRAGDIRYFVREVPFDLPGGIKHRVDFMAVTAAGEPEWIEAKGRDLREGRNKRKQVEALYGIKINLWTGK